MRCARNGTCGAAPAARGALRSLADSRGVSPVIREGVSVYQTSYKFLCELLREILTDRVQAEPDADQGLGSPQCRLKWRTV
jgi:hypothetical protein